MVKFLSRNVVILFLIVLYRILLDYVYINFTNPVWGYAGFENNASSSSSIISWMVLIVLSLLILPYYKCKESFYPELLILFFVMRVVPSTVLIRFLNLPTNFCLLYFVYFAFIFILTKAINIHQVPLKIKGTNGSHDTILYLGLFFFSAIIIFVSGYYADFRLHLSFADVYDLRHEAKGFDMPIIMRYAWSPATNILPLLFVYFMRKHKKVVCLFIFMVVVLNFSINGLKSTIFKLLICIIFGFVKIKDYKPYFIPAYIALLIVTIIEGSMWDLQVIHDVVIRRAVFIPPLLDTNYYDYITSNGPMFYARGGTAIQYIIGDVYYGAPEMDCNNGLFSDAYMNLGVIGCFLYPLLYAVLFRICGSAFRGVDKGLIVFAAIIIAFGIESSELTTALLTHGLFLFSVFMYLISIKNNGHYMNCKG